MERVKYDPGELRLDYVPNEHPDFRLETGHPTSKMVQEITKFVEAYKQISPEQRSWAEGPYMMKAIGQYLYQVNWIEGEGFDTYDETQSAIDNGLLLTKGRRQSEREEHVCSLYRASMHWFKQDDDTWLSNLTLDEIERTHKLLLGSTDRSIAGKFRYGDELVYSRTRSMSSCGLRSSAGLFRTWSTV